MKNALLSDSVRIDSADEPYDLVSDELSPEEMYIAKEAKEAFFDAVGEALGERDREVLMLYLASVSYKEISERLGMTAKQVDNALYHAKKKLARLMDSLKNPN